MDKQRRGILLLVKSAVTGKAYALPEGFSLQDAIPVIESHSLTTLACEGAIKCGFPEASPMVERLFGTYCEELIRSEKQRSAVDRICTAFEKNGIDYMPLKGCNMKALYPRPEFRVMGDADILVRMEQYGKIRPVMEDLGFVLQKESDHEYVWHREGVCVELHKRLIPSYNPDYYAYFGDGWQLARNRDGCRYAMTREDAFIFIFTHFAKHYRDGGIGCRHVLDLWVYRVGYPDLDMAYIRRELEKLRLLEFYENTCRLIGYWFEDGQSDDRTALMTDFIFESGNWGAWERHVLSAEVKSRKTVESPKLERVKSICAFLFQPADVLSGRYPVLKKAPWLLPAMWPVRWLDAALFRRENVLKKQKEFRDTSMRKVDNYENALRFVGLDFRLQK